MNGNGVLAQERYPQLLQLVSAIHSTLCLDTLPRKYLDAVPDCIRATGYGFYLMDHQKGVPRRIEAVGVSKRFLQRYEKLRTADPLFRRIKRVRRPVVLGRLEGSRSASGFSRLYAEERLAHSLLAPVYVSGNLVGTLNFARSENEPPFDQRDLELAEILSRHISYALDHSLAFERLRRERAWFRAALDALPVPLTLTAPAFGGFTNRAAVAVLGREPGVTSRPNLPSAHQEHLPTEDGATLQYLLPGRPAPPPAPATLTPRERELVQHLIQGLSNQELAAVLGVTINTIKQHLKGIYSKLGVRTRAELVARMLGR